MKIIVIGLGSMGKRRIRLLKEHTHLQIFGVDSNVERCKDVQQSLKVMCFQSLDEALAIRDLFAAFVCTSPLSHASIIRECLEANLHVFTEINLVQDDYDENMSLAKQKGCVLFLSSTFLYRKETQYLIRRVQETQCRVNYIYHVGQYLPDWHPWESYNNYFIGDKRTNGCREIMAIDMPWLVTAFGRIKNVQFLKSKNTELNIQYNDNYLLLIEHETGHKGVFVVDVVARKPYRHIDIYGEQLQLSWNGTADTVLDYDVATKQEVAIPMTDADEHIDGYAAFISENPYREEIRAFLLQIENPNNQPLWDFEKDKHILNWIDKIEA